MRFLALSRACRLLVTAIVAVHSEGTLACSPQARSEFYFPPCSSDLTPSYAAQTEYLVAALRSRPAKYGRVVVVSSAELDESSFGWALAEGRALAIRGALLTAGLTDRPIEVSPELPDPAKPKHPLTESRRAAFVFWVLAKGRQECVETHTSCGRMCKVVLEDGTDCYPF